MFRIRAIIKYTWAGRDYEPGQVIEIADDRERPQFQFMHDHVPGVIEMLADDDAKGRSSSPKPAPVPALPPASAPDTAGDAVDPMPQQSSHPVAPMTTDSADAIVPAPRRRYVRKPHE